LVQSFPARKSRIFFAFPAGARVGKRSRSARRQKRHRNARTPPSMTQESVAREKTRNDFLSRHLRVTALASADAPCKRAFRSDHRSR
jgi:hypothetical protein